MVWLLHRGTTRSIRVHLLPDDWKVLRDDLKAKPRNRTPADVGRLLRAAGFTATPGKGSHTNYKKEGHFGIVTVPGARTLDIGYVRQAIRAAEASNEE